jgi:hypothetical protein
MFASRPKCRSLEGGWIALDGLAALGAGAGAAVAFYAATKGADVSEGGAIATGTTMGVFFAAQPFVADATTGAWNTDGCGVATQD